MTDEEFAEFEDMITEYGQSCADVVSAQEFGAGTSGAERDKKIAYKAVIDFAIIHFIKTCRECGGTTHTPECSHVQKFRDMCPE